MEHASQSTNVADLSDQITPSAHASGVPKIDVPTSQEAVRKPALWPRNLATTLVILATSLYLLEQLQLVLRPLLIAILLCYLIVPTYARLRKRMRPLFSFLLIILVLLVGFQALSRMIFSDMTGINRNLPRYQRRAEELSDQARNIFEPFLPPSLLPERSRQPAQSSMVQAHVERTSSTSEAKEKVSSLPAEDDKPYTISKTDEGNQSSGLSPEGKSRIKDRLPREPELDSKDGSISDLAIHESSRSSSDKKDPEPVLDADNQADPEMRHSSSTSMVPPPKPMPTESPTWELTRRVVSQVASAIASFLLESLVVAFYMIFLLQEAGRFGDRIRTSFSREHATQIEAVATSINRAISDYLSVKVKSSLIVAIPTALTVFAFGITGAASWGVLAFFGNFLPYVGGLVATLIPITLAYLEFDSILYPTLFAVVLVGISGVTSNLIEPAMTGKALDLSPLVVMIGLAFWSLLWGFVGMCLAVPMTVVLKIVLEHTPATRPIARLLGESQRLT